MWLNCLFFQQGNSSKEFNISSDVASSLKSLYFIVFITLYNCRCKSLWYNEQSCYKTKNIEYLLYRSLTRTVLGAAILVSCLMLRWSIGISEWVKVIKHISDTLKVLNFDFDKSLFLSIAIRGGRIARNLVGLMYQ